MTINANTATANTPNIPLHYAQLYLAAGYSPISVKSRDKRPVDDAWQNTRLTEEDLPCRFRRDNNVSVLLGDPSSGIVDIDLDDPAALRLAPYFLPETEFVFGRASKPRSHFIYRVPSPGNIKKFAAGKRNIVEVRATGGHTVFPGSVAWSRGAGLIEPRSRNLSSVRPIG